MICDECETVAHCMKNGCVPKTTKKDEAMKLALEALENSVDLVSHEARNAEELYGKYPSRLARIQGLVAFEVAHEKAIIALREALAEQPAPVQQKQPVAWIEHYQGSIAYNPYREAAKQLPDGIRFDLYTSTAQRTWVGLTDDEIWQVWGPVARRMFGMHHLIHTMDVNGINNESMVLNLARAIEAKLKERSA